MSNFITSGDGQISNKTSAQYFPRFSEQPRLDGNSCFPSFVGCKTKENHETVP